ncbi:MAG: hypothetical protein ABH824_05220 [Nanoarchaeota archaeon]|nr:hypothetical protein [Nanoarchaeota archaeon]MBU1632815.1 hypothetical protein [Nanoarchaeota archaeon]MBU1876492.1 hypothetical protein [Nanoarchaeota archaeon]
MGNNDSYKKLELPNINIALVHIDMEGNKNCYALGEDGNLYAPANLEAYLFPYSEKALYTLYSKDRFLIEKIRFQSIEDYLIIDEDNLEDYMVEEEDEPYRNDR